LNPLGGLVDLVIPPVDIDVYVPLGKFFLDDIDQH